MPALHVDTAYTILSWFPKMLLLSQHCLASFVDLWWNMSSLTVPAVNPVFMCAQYIQGASWGQVIQAFPQILRAITQHWRCVYVYTIYAGGFLRTSDSGIPPDSQRSLNTGERSKHGTWRDGLAIKITCSSTMKTRIWMPVPMSGNSQMSAIPAPRSNAFF